MRCGGSASAKRAEGGAHALAAFADRLVGQADHGEGEMARRDQHLDVDRQHIDALESHGPHLCLHMYLRFTENNYRGHYPF